MTRQFWIDHLVDVPITILLAVLMIFVSPYVQRWRDKQAITRGQKKNERVKEHYTKVLLCSLDPHGLTQYLVLQAIMVVMAAVNATVGMVWDTLVSIRAQSGPLTYWLLWWTIAATFLAVSGVWWLTRTAAHASTLWAHVQSFDKYVASVPSEFRNLELEAKAREKLRLVSGNTVPSAG